MKQFQKNETIDAIVGKNLSAFNMKIQQLEKIGDALLNVEDMENVCFLLVFNFLFY